MTGPSPDDLNRGQCAGRLKGEAPCPNDHDECCFQVTDGLGVAARGRVDDKRVTACVGALTHEYRPAEARKVRETFDREPLSLHERNFTHYRIQAGRDSMAGGFEQAESPATSVEGLLDHITGNGVWFR